MRVRNVPRVPNSRCKALKLMVKIENDPFKDHEATFEDLNEVLGREWFKRMWTYQEILLASSPVLICGDRSVLWDTFARTIIFLENCGVNYTGYALDGTLDPDKLGTIHDLQNIYALVFSRDNLMALGERNSAQQSQGGAVQLADSAEQSTDLCSYESFIQSITPKYRKLRRRFSWLRYIMCFLAALMIATVGTTAATNQSRRAANRDAALMSSVVDEILSRPSSTSRATSTPTPGPTSTRAPSASVTATIFTSATRTLLGLQATITPFSIPASFSLDSAKSEYIESCSSSCLARVTAPMSTCLHSCVHEYNPENEKPPFPTVAIVLPSIFLAVFIGLTIFFCCVTMNETAGYKLKPRGRVITWNGKMPSESPRREDIGQNVIAALRSRNATHNADKAFAVQPILRRLADIEILAPDYSLELKEIYKGLTIQVIQSTGSLKPLLLAAQHRFPQFLSWVPDWSTEFETFWNRQTDARNDNFKASLDSKPSWHVSPENDSLTVRGRRICAITDCVEFQETQNVYLPEEKQVHLENLRKLLQLEFSRTEIAYLAWELKFEQRANAGYEATNWCYRLSSYMKRDIEKQGLEKWFQKIEKSVLRGYKLCEELDVDPEDLHFDHWRKSHTFTNNSAGYDDYDFFQTHIYMCNVLARNKRQIFITDKIDPYRGKDSRPGVYSFPWSNEASRKEFLEKMAERGSRPYAGISRFEVKIGDELILIAGLHLPLVVRVEGDSRRLVSPAIVAFMMEGEFWNSALEESGLDEFRLC